MKYLKSYMDNYRYKLCIICGNKNKLHDMLEGEMLSNDISTWLHFTWKFGGQKRCGYILFVYFGKLKDALKLREKLYNRKDLYVLLQDDKQINDYYIKQHQLLIEQ